MSLLEHQLALTMAVLSEVLNEYIYKLGPMTADWRALHLAGVLELNLH